MATANRKKRNQRAIRWFIVPSLLVSFLITFIVPDLRTVGILYLIMSAYALFIFSLPRFQEEIFGVKTSIGAPILVGGGTAVGFLVLSSISPAFSLLTPVIPLSVSSDIRLFVIVALAPVIEEMFRSATLGLLDDVYKLKFATRNFIQGAVFASLHVLVYGVALAAYSTWFQLYGAFAAISGSLIAAMVFGMISGFMMKRFDNTTPSIISHMIINFYLISSGLIVVS